MYAYIIFPMALRNLLFVLLSIRTLTEAVYVYGEPKYKCPEKPKLIYPCHCNNGSDIGIYVTCDNTNLATLSVAMQNLAALQLPVEHLSINKGNFERLYGPIFSKVHIRHLTILATPISTLEDYVFFGVNNTLEILELIETNVSRITPLSFGILGNLVNLKIDGHNFTMLSKDLFVEQYISGRLEVLRLTNGPLNDISNDLFQLSICRSFLDANPIMSRLQKFVENKFKNRSLPIISRIFTSVVDKEVEICHKGEYSACCWLKPLRRLKTLDLHGNALESLKRNQFKNLRDLEVLDISFNKLKKLEAQHIADLTKLGWCNVSNNALSELARGTFARNAVLKVLNLSHNRIQRLDANSFRGMRFLRRLYMSDNRISDVGRGTFGSVARIGTIDLARNALKKIEFQMFSQLNYVEILDLAENNITIIEKNSFKDIYQALINISHNGLETIQPKAFENCVNITTLDLSFNKLKNFSRNVFDETTFATNFQLSHNFLTNLAHIPLQNMTGLKVLNASHNHITQIPKNTFPKLYELHTIDLSHNNISIIFNAVFQSLFSLRSINLSHNNLQEVKSSMFGTLPTLLDLNLSHNNLKNIVRGALAKLTSLRFLNLNHNLITRIFQIPISLNELHMSDNKIESIPSGTWPVMNSLIYLDLSKNLLGDSLDEHSFSGLLVLQKLLLQENNITKPPLECLAGMSTLQYLYMQNNNITVLEKSAFGKLPVLFELNLFGNGVKEINKRAFEGLLQLLNLNLSSNALQYIPTDAFKGLPSLRKLDLSHNFIAKLDNKTHGVLDDLLSLEDLNLSFNKISFVTKKTFPENQYIPYNLKYLDLSHNQMPVLTYDITFGTKKLIKLNLSYNSINELRRGVLGNFTHLQYLDLSNNELSNLQSEEHIFDLPQNLTTLLLNNNQIYKLNFTKFLKEPKFEIIDLSNNSLTEFPLSLVWNIRNGTRVKFAGNPLHCNCAARPLKHYLMELAYLSEDLSLISCNTPEFNKDQYLKYVEDQSLQCITEDEKEMFHGVDFDKVSDVRFRDIVVKNGNVSIRWFVVSARDVADFIVYVRDPENNILYQQELDYNVRKTQIPTDLFRTEQKVEKEICIIAKNSNGITGNWFHAQCEKLPLIKEKRKFFFFTTASSAKRNSVFNELQQLVVFLNLLLIAVKLYLN